jgi:hypothetical protein
MAIGRYSDELNYTSGRPVLGASVLVLTTTGTAASLFTDEGGGTPAANPIDYAPAAPGETGVDLLANLTFYADTEAPGPYYDIVVTPPSGTAFDPLTVRVEGAGGTADNITVSDTEPPDPDEGDIWVQPGGTTSATGAANFLSTVKWGRA